MSSLTLTFCVLSVKVFVQSMSPIASCGVCRACCCSPTAEEGDGNEHFQLRYVFEALLSGSFTSLLVHCHIHIQLLIEELQHIEAFAATVPHTPYDCTCVFA